MSSRTILGVLVVLTCIAFVARFAIGPKPGGPADLSGLERAAASGEVQAMTGSGDSLSVWANDFHRIEPALDAAAGDSEIRLMIGATQVGVYSRRAGIQVKDTP